MNFNEAYYTLNSLYEAKRVISDTDILYHYTNPTPLLKIFTEDCLRADVHLQAVCLTTDKDYIIYDYPCGIQFSREKLTQAGYELVEFDEFADDPDSRGESEERIYKNITDVSKYVTVVYVDWDKIPVVQSPEGDRIADAVYDEHGNENESYDLMLDDFKAILNNLKSKGIIVKENGSPMFGEYYLDAYGKLCYGEMPAELAIAS
jgi:hypothetical protein